MRSAWRGENRPVEPLPADAARGSLAGLWLAAGLAAFHALAPARLRVLGVADAAALREGEAWRAVTALTLHADVRFASQRDQAAFAAEVTRVVGKLIEKFHDDRAPQGRTFRVLAGAWPAPSGDSRP